MVTSVWWFVGPSKPVLEVLETLVMPRRNALECMFAYPVTDVPLLCLGIVGVLVEIPSSYDRAESTTEAGVYGA